ncbi:hypothetical protein V5799_015320 [Amblyomma americanum]|uniref:Uncharacterized protein n=1 Tax=Amblyomma americanum TaxID=6943 RepID=A0AAQ4E0H7_AMBAM
MCLLEADGDTFTLAGDGKVSISTVQSRPVPMPKQCCAKQTTKRICVKFEKSCLRFFRTARLFGPLSGSRQVLKIGRPLYYCFCLCFHISG